LAFNFFLFFRYGIDDILASKGVAFHFGICNLLRLVTVERLPGEQNYLRTAAARKKAVEKG
jgi:hypothetical protein